MFPIDQIVHYTYKYIAKPFLFRRDPEDVHDTALTLGKTLGKSVLVKSFFRVCFGHQDDSLRQTVCGITFQNPIGLAAGFDKNADILDILPTIGFGYAEVGSVTGEACVGNAKPRLWRIPEEKSLRVYYGLKNDGAEAISARLKGKTFTFPVGVSIAKTNSPATVETEQGIADYMKAAEAFRDIGDYITINTSCPNAFGGEAFSDPARLELLLKAYRELKIHKPTFLKLAADLTHEQLDQIIELSNTYNIDGFICTNLKKEAGEKGGLSGKSVASLSDDMIANIYKKVGKKKVIIGCGGIFSGEDAYRKIRKGATLVQLITGMIYEGPQLISEINRDLVRLLKQDGYTHISEVIGINTL